VIELEVEIQEAFRICPAIVVVSEYIRSAMGCILQSLPRNLSVYQFERQ
jgi:hypothetical protein